MQLPQLSREGTAQQPLKELQPRLVNAPFLGHRQFHGNLYNTVVGEEVPILRVSEEEHKAQIGYGGTKSVALILSLQPLWVNEVPTASQET